jgi:hypothetical protein
VRWDGFADTGAPAAHGVYFLRARIGNAASVSRIVYLAQ